MSEMKLGEFLDELDAKYTTVIGGWGWSASIPVSTLLDMATYGAVKVETGDIHEVEVHVRCKKEDADSVARAIKGAGGTVVQPGDRRMPWAGKQ